MDYIETVFATHNLTPEKIEILIAELGELGYESFVDEGIVLKAYIVDEQFDNAKLSEVVGEVAPEISFDSKLIPRENWNQTWESKYSPIEVEAFCYIHAPFHPVNTQIPINVLIEPKMSFGTGHHQTTRLVIQAMRAIEFQSKKVLDMGCGTGVLAIVASKLGAKTIDAIDTDEWAVENSIENAKHNMIDNIEVKQGDSASIVENYDVILANINRNVLLKDMNIYAHHLKHGGNLVLSGFYSIDENTLIEEAEKWGLKLRDTIRNDGWSCLHFIKI